METEETFVMDKPEQVCEEGRRLRTGEGDKG